MYQTITNKITKERTIERKIRAEGIDENNIINYKKRLSKWEPIMT